MKQTILNKQHGDKTEGTEDLTRPEEIKEDKYILNMQ